MHTPALDPNGTDLHAVKELCPDSYIIFSQKTLSEIKDGLCII